MGSSLWPEIKPGPPALELGVLTTDNQGSPRNTSFYCAFQILGLFVCFPHKLKVCVATSCTEQAPWYHFSNICPLCISVSHFAIWNISNFIIIFVKVILWLVILCYYCTVLESTNCSYIRRQTINVYVLTASPTGHSLFLLLLRPPYSPRCNNIEIRRINNLTMTSKCSWKKCLMSHFNPKLIEIIKLMMK